jgi:ABC-type phosphate transport system permease subunit
MAKWLITIGIACVVLGLAWPLLTKLGFGKLPGDVRIEKEKFGFYFPIATSVIISIVLTIILWIFRR